MSPSSNHRPARARLKPLALLETRAKELQELAWSWQRANESITYEQHLLRFAYKHTPAHKVPGFVRDRAAGMVKRCCRALTLEKVSIMWLEWCLAPSRSVCFVLNHPVRGMALTPKRSGDGFDLPGARVNRPGLLAGLANLQGAVDVVLIRWDVPMMEMLFTVAHEIKHLWFSYNDHGQSLIEEEAACNAFAHEAMKRFM